MKRNKKKSNNKGFSLVELIIVIAIMAILSGALAPQLIKYIDRSRKAADVQTAQTIATAVNTALANESAYDSVVDGATIDITTLSSSTTDIGKAVYSVLGANPVPKYKKTIYTKFWVKFTVSSGDKSFVVYTTDGTDNNTLYPTVSSLYNQ